VDEETETLLASDHPGQRIQGLRLVALLEDRDAATRVRRVLAQDPEPEVREHAARAVSVLAPDALDALARAAEKDQDPLVRRTSLAVLGELGTRDASGALARLVGVASREDRPTALEALRACGDPSVAPVAAEHLQGDATTRAVALHAFAALGAPATPAVLEAATTLASNGPLWVVAAAARLRGVDPAPLIRAPLIGARSFERERVALRALELDRATAAAVLREVLRAPERAPEDHGAALLAARELARRGDRSGAPLLARTLYRPDARGHLEAALALAELGSSCGQPFLRRALPQAAAHERPLVARGLALCLQADGVNALGALLSSEVPLDRRYAARGLAELGRRDGVAELVRTLDHPFRREREEALAALRVLWREGPATDPLASSNDSAPAVRAWAGHFGVS
jgi:HEAT repeat protein